MDFNNHFLSMTGIDKVEENTEAITKMNDDISVFMKTVVPTFAVKNSSAQQINGAQTFTSPINCVGLSAFNGSISMTTRTKNSITLHETGTTIVGAIKADDEALQIRNISGLKTALDHPIIPNGSIGGIQLKYSTVMGGNIAPETIENVNIKDLTITGDKVAQKSIRGDFKIVDYSVTGTQLADKTIGTRNLASNLEIGTTGIISTVNSLNCGSLMVWDCLSSSSVKNPQLHISIPFLPIKNDSNLVSQVSFFVPNLSITTNPMMRYRHPFNYFIHGISVLYDDEAAGNTATIIFSLYDIGGKGTAAALGTASIKTNLGIACDYFKFPSALFVPSTNSLGASHAFSGLSADKEVTYVLWGFQA